MSEWHYVKEKNGYDWSEFVASCPPTEPFDKYKPVPFMDCSDVVIIAYIPKGEDKVVVAHELAVFGMGCQWWWNSPRSNIEGKVVAWMELPRYEEE